MKTNIESTNRGVENILRSYKEITVHNPEPYCSIYEFISSSVIPKYPCLTNCYQDNFDEEGNPRVQYYIKYAADLSMGQCDQLFLNILNDIEEFCGNSGIPFNEDLAADFILSRDGNFS